MLIFFIDKTGGRKSFDFDGTLNRPARDVAHLPKIIVVSRLKEKTLEGPDALTPLHRARRDTFRHFEIFIL